MIEHSLPPSDRTEPPDPVPAPAPASATKHYNKDLVFKLRDYKQRNELSASDLATELGCHASAVSKYLNEKPEGNVDRLEQIIADILANEDRRRESKNTLFDTPVTSHIARTLDKIRETNDVGLIFAPAGIGKTCACQLYAAQNPSAILITATQYRRDSGAIEFSLAAQCSTRGPKRHVRRSEFLVERFRFSNRLVIIDNAHLLIRSGIQWLFDFADETNIPIGLVGNPEVLDLIRTSDQRFSRVGIKDDIGKLKPDDTSKVIRRQLIQLLPTADEGTIALATLVGENAGRFRAVRKQATLARRIFERSPKPTTLEDAFRSAHTQLVRDYKL